MLWIGEGTSDIQELIISGMIFAPHAARLLPIIDSEYSIKDKFKYLFKASYYGLWIPAKIISILKNGIEFLFTGSERSYLKFASNRLALKSLWLMARYGSGLLKEQVATAFIANQLTDLWVMAAVLWYAEQLYPKHGHIVNEIADIHCSYARARIRGDSDDKPSPSLDKRAYDLGQKIIFEDAVDFLETDVATVLDRELKR